jgi:hypothetical protein
MGGGKHKAHESFAVSPSTSVVPEGLTTVDAEDLAVLDAASGPAAEHLAKLDAAVKDAMAAAAGAGPPAEQYGSLKAATQEALAEVEAAKEAGVPPQLLAESEQDLKKLTKGYLGGLDAAELQSLAAQEGFEHPLLVGLNSPPGQHPLVHWLDPAYPGELPSKLAIQAKADERYGALAAGETVGGLKLADVQAAEAAMAPPPPGSWTATPAEVVSAQAQLHQALADFGFGKGLNGPPDGGVGGVLAAENLLATASCPELGGNLDVAKGAAKASVDTTLASLTVAQRKVALAKVMAASQAEGTVSEAETKYLTPVEQLALLRSSTSPTETAGVKALAAGRAEQFAKLEAAKAAYPGTATALAGLDTPEGKAAAGAFANAAADYFARRTQVAAWAQGVAASAEITPVCGYGSWDSAQHAAALTTEWRNWAKTQKLADLRDVASSLGMSSTAKASRAQLQNYVAATWDPALEKSSIVAAVAAPKKPPAPKAPAPAAPALAPAPAPAKPVPGPSAPPSAKSFAAKHLQIVAALKAHQALAADLPARPPAAEVASWEFGPAQAANLGGAHTKSLHTAPDGSVWMFKPDSQAGGARAHAEATASEILARAGVPSVPVYARKVGGKPGSIQPLVKGASTLSADPKSWSQADVDGIVRYHVAAWATGDHDGNPHNMLRTPSGGLCPIDHGQAFKFYGQDRLAADFHPNSSFGSVPVFHQAYSASKAGTLATGVAVRPEAALPTIKAFEAMPDAAYRAMLAPVATEGVKSKVHWAEPMRKAAQKRLGKTQVSDAEVAEEFLHEAVQRKNGLRSAFASFFSANGFAGGSKLEKVA